MEAFCGLLGQAQMADAFAKFSVTVTNYHLQAKAPALALFLTSVSEKVIAESFLKLRDGKKYNDL